MTRTYGLVQCGKEVIQVRAHPNAPIVLNYRSKAGRYNKNPLRMKYINPENREWWLDWLQRQSGENKIWYANDGVLHG